MRKLIEINDSQTRWFSTAEDANKTLQHLRVEREEYQGRTIIDFPQAEETGSGDPYSDFCSQTLAIEDEQPGDMIVETWVYREDVKGGAFEVHADSRWVVEA